MSKNTKIVLALLAAVLVLAVVPFFLAPGAHRLRKRDGYVNTYRPSFNI